MLWSLLLSCTPDPSDTATTTAVIHAPIDISAENLRDHVDYLADDARGGRVPGSPGHAEARDYLVDQMSQIGLVPLGDDGVYTWAYTTTGRDDRYMIDASGDVVPADWSAGTDIVGLLPGSDPERAGEYVLLMAHYDHLGVTSSGSPYNGALDDAAGVAAVLEVARAMVEADLPPARSVVFLLTDDEESGLVGAEKWLADPTVPLEDIVVGLSADPLGRPVLPDFWPMALLGTERSPAMRDLWDTTLDWAADQTDLSPLFINRDLVSLFASDQDELFQVGLPGVWVTNPGMAFYHQPEDDAETIDYRVLQQSTAYLTHVIGVIGDDTGYYDYEGPAALDGAAGRDALALLDGVLASTELDDDERAQVEGFRAILEEGTAADDLTSIEDLDTVIVQVMAYVLFYLSGPHLGPIPPPFPG